MTSAGQESKPAFWFDVEDLFTYALSESRPSGIQRLAFEVHRELVTDPALAGRVRFVRHDPGGLGFVEIDWTEIEALFRKLSRPKARRSKPTSAVKAPAVAAEAPSPRTGLRGALGRSVSPEFKVALGRFVGTVLASLGAFRGAFAAFGPAFRAVPLIFASIPPVIRMLVSNRPPPLPPPRSETTEAAAPVAHAKAPVPDRSPFRRGDVLACLGAPWFDYSHAERIRTARRVHGVGFALLTYDIIPARRPEWCDQHLVKVFKGWLDAMLPMSDQVLSISRASAGEMERYAAEQGIALKGPVRPIPIGSGFTDLHPPVAEAEAEADAPPLVEGDYALIVSTIEARKNHMLLFRVWRRLLEELPADKVPTLVFAGRVGWLVADLMQQLKNADYLGGKVVVIEEPGDEELKRLYQGCLFTLFPSLYEGWGLPVTESLMFGKPCVLSNTTSLPEAGGEFGRYFDPDNLDEAYEVVRRTIEDREGLKAWEADIRARFRPTPWSAAAAVVVEALEACLPDGAQGRSGRAPSA